MLARYLFFADLLTSVQVDFIGRKVLLLWCCVIVGAGMLVLALGFLAGLGNSVALFMCGCSLVIGGYRYVRVSFAMTMFAFDFLI